MAVLLLVEDSPVNQRLAQAVLEEAGHTVVVVKDGFEAMTALRQAIPDLILMDISLPRIDGLSLTRLLKDDPDYAGIPILCCTVHTLNGNAAQAAAAGCDDYLSKPSSNEALLEKVAALLAAKEK